LKNRIQLIDNLIQRLNKTADIYLSNKQNRLIKNISMLDALSPLKNLQRGYAIAKSEKGKIIKSVSAVKVGDKIDVNLTDGALKCNILEMKEL